MNWRDSMQVERFLDALAQALARGLGHPAAIEAARREAEAAGPAPPPFCNKSDTKLPDLAPN